MPEGRPIVTILGLQPGSTGVLDDDLEARKGTVMVLAVVLIVLAILLGLGGLVFTALKWLLIVAVVLLIAGVVAGVLGRGKTRSLR